MLPPGTEIYKKQTFLSWLYERYGETPAHLYRLCNEIGKASAYYKVGKGIYHDVTSRNRDLQKADFFKLAL